MTDIAVIPDLFPEVEPYAGNTDENQRFTTDECDAWLRTCARVKAWDLDVAACEESHRAPKFYIAAPTENGLTLPWFGRVFCNPPWDDIEPWVKRAFYECGAPGLECIGFVLPGGRTHRPWWQKWVEPFRDGKSPISSVHVRTFNPPKRFAYGHPGNPRGIGVAEPNFTTVGLVWTRDPMGRK